MKSSKALIIVGVVTAVIILGIVYSSFQEDNAGSDEREKISKDVGVYSGPLAVTQTEYKLGESVFFHVRGLQPNEKGNIHVITPEGILFKTYPYDGSLKTDFNQFFTPDTYKPFGLCKPEQLVGTWRMIFEDGSYPPVEFEFIDEFIRSGEVNIQIEC